MSLPDANEIESGVTSQIAGLESRRVRAPFTLEIAQRALKRVNLGRAPSGSNNEQFRDCCVWEHCLDFGKTDDVHLISADKDFAENWKSLGAEAESAQSSIRHHKTLHEFIDSLPKIEPTDEGRVRNEIIKLIVPKLREYASIYSFEVPNQAKGQLSTPKSQSGADHLLTFGLDFSMRDSTDAGRENATLQANGLATVAKEEVVSARIEDIKVSWTTSSGVPQESRFFANTEPSVPTGWMNSNTGDVAIQVARYRQGLNAAVLSTTGVFTPPLPPQTPTPAYIDVKPSRPGSIKD